jgi:hypothetical protein
VLHVHPKHLPGRIERHVPAHHGAAAGARLLFRPSPSRRLCRLVMSRAAFLRIVAGWTGALATLLVLALAMRWS